MDETGVICLTEEETIENDIEISGVYTLLEVEDNNEDGEINYKSDIDINSDTIFDDIQLIEFPDQTNLIDAEEIDKNELLEDENVISNIPVKSKKYNCNFCKKEYARDSTLQKHISTHHMGKSEKKNENNEYFEINYLCKYCVSVGFASEYECNEHQKTHENNFKCKYCNKTLLNEKECRDHEDSHIDKAVYSCRMCNKIFLIKQTWEEHEKNGLCIQKIDQLPSAPLQDIVPMIKLPKDTDIIEIISDDEKIEKNDLNDKKKVKKSKKNGRIRNVVAIYKCDICSTSFCLKKNLRFHIKNFHSDENKKQKGESSSKMIIENNLNDSNNKIEIYGRFECSNCVRYFLTENDLKYHKLKCGNIS